MQATLQSQKHCSVLRVSGDLRLWDHECDQRELLNLLPADMVFPGKRLVLGLADLTHIDSLGITALVKIVILCTKNHVGICTVLPGGTAGQAIRSTRIFAAWPEFESQDAAISKFAQHAAS
jgi:anti-anti-sigma regulatory factor